MPTHLGSYLFMFAFFLQLSCSEKNDQTTTQKWPDSFGFGNSVALNKIQKWDKDVRPDGRGLPEGFGTITQGRILYLQKCAMCHGKSLTEGPYNQLKSVSYQADTTRDHHLSEAKTIGNYGPYATTLYDYIQRAMPTNAPGSLTPEEVYSLTGYLLYENGLIDSTIKINKKSLVSVKMPAASKYFTDDRAGGPLVK